MKRNSLLTAAATVLLLSGCSSKPPATETPKAAAEAPAPPQEPTHAVVGEVQEVDPQGSSITIRTSSGEVHRIQVDSEAQVSSVKQGASETGKGISHLAKAVGTDIKKGTLVAVKYTEREGKLVAHEVKHASKEAVKGTEVVVHKIADGGKKVVVKTKDGAEHVYEVSKDVTVTAGKKIAKAGESTGSAISEGAKATLHFTEEQGGKVVHFVSH